ncbi:MAG: GlsB/YeaQ/YmgE family stress response membrane protein [Alphaproteobacteria bacterium]
MGFLTWVLLGLVAGVLAKWIMPGKDPGGIIVTIAIGVVGAMLGGYLGTVAGIGSVSGFNLMSIFLAVGGAIILLLAYRAIKK